MVWVQEEKKKRVGVAIAEGSLLQPWVGVNVRLGSRRWHCHTAEMIPISRLMTLDLRILLPRLKARAWVVQEEARLSCDRFDMLDIRSEISSVQRRRLIALTEDMVVQVRAHLQQSRYVGDILMVDQEPSCTQSCKPLQSRLFACLLWCMLCHQKASSAAFS
jgi:hypothetical protein